MTEPERLTTRQLTLWTVVIVVALVIGATLTIMGFNQLAQPEVPAIQLPIGVILVVFGVVMAVLIGRHQRRFPRA